MDSIGIVILAAGGSTRLGQPKQLLVWEGETLLRQTTRTALKTGLSSVVVVLGAQAERLQEEVSDLPVMTCVNDKWEEGMGSSIRVGLATLLATHEPLDAVLILLCDQPLLTVETLRVLMDSYRGSRSAVVSRYRADALGPPCLFGSDLFPQLLSLQGAQGAKQVFGKLPAEFLAHRDFPEGISDIDTAADWEAFVLTHPTSRLL